MFRTSAAMACAVLLLATQTGVADDKKSGGNPVDKLLKLDKSGVGAKYGARDPLILVSKKEPLTGAPSAEQARAYMISCWECEKGGFAPELYLTENVKLEISKGRPATADDGQTGIDVKEPVYDVQGSYTYYRCYPINLAHPKGKNCDKIELPNASGVCYKTTFGEWKCYMGDVRTGKSLTGYFPPPADDEWKKDRKKDDEK